jgi:hypothetical protein
MTLQLAFHRAAQAEFIEAAAWYDSKRAGLAMEFIAEIDRCVSLASAYPQNYALVLTASRTVFTFAPSKAVSLCWPYFIAAETLLFG